MPGRALPHDFAEHSAQEGNLKLRRRYRCGGKQIEAWRAECGVTYQGVPKPTGSRLSLFCYATKPGRKSKEDDYSCIGEGFDDMWVPALPNYGHGEAFA